jgi:hypothetical protein
MIIYSVTFAIEPSIENDWEAYMKSHHIPRLMNSSYFSDFQHTKIIPEQGLDLAFNIQLSCKDLTTLNKYISEEKELHELPLHEKFNGKFASFFTKLEKLN